MYSVFRRAAVRARILANPIGAALQEYVLYLARRGHRAGTLHQYVFAVEHFGRWLGRRPIDPVLVDRFIRHHLPRCRCEKPAVGNIPCVRAALNRLLEMLGKQRSRLAGTGLTDRLLRKYEDHLVRVCGLSRATVHYRLRYARELLGRFSVHQARQLRQWSPAQIACYVSSVGRQCKPSSGQVVASSIRSFLRFLRLHGLIHRDLAAAVPSFANWRLASLPAPLGRADLEALLHAVDTSTPIGTRDHAVLLCMTELGLRGADVAALQLEGVDLAARILRLHRPKQREQIELPMPRRLAAAIRLYLHRGRPTCRSASLFVIHRAPIGGGLRPIGIRSIVLRRAAQAGLGERVRGTHVIRHTLATEWINAGASLKEIADLLGHRSIDTTRIYAKVDLRSLSAVALPWPGRREVRP